MSQGNTQTVATFKGTLLKREHTTGQKFVQLVFREKDKNWLCISTNLKYAKLQSGKQYRIQGISKMLGDERQYIHEPEITPVVRHLGLKQLLLSVGIVLFVATTTASAVRLMNGSLTPTSAESDTGHHTVTTKTTDDTAKPEEAAQATTETTPAPTTPATTTKKKTTSSSSGSSTNNTPVVTPPPTPGGSPQNPQPYCGEQFNIVPFSSTTQEDSSHEPGYVITQGVNGYSQTCYSGVAGDPGTTTVTQPITQVTAVPPPTPPAES